MRRPNPCLYFGSSECGFEKILAPNRPGLAQSALIAAAFSPEVQVDLKGAMNGGTLLMKSPCLPTGSAKLSSMPRQMRIPTGSTGASGREVETAKLGDEEKR
jgi:hypothetical protein